jgi:hypothetical protein
LLVSTALGWLCLLSSRPGVRVPPGALLQEPAVSRPAQRCSSSCLRLAGDEFLRSRGTRAMLFEALGDPHLDDRLPGDPQAPGLPVQRIDHPHREVHIDPPLLETGPASASEVDSDVTSSPWSNRWSNSLAFIDRYLLLAGAANGDNFDPLLPGRSRRPTSACQLADQSSATSPRARRCVYSGLPTRTPGGRLLESLSKDIDVIQKSFSEREGIFCVVS